MTDIFISYSRKDIDFAHLIYQSLHDSNFDIWIDWQNILIDEDWRLKIREAIENANVFMFIISNHSINSLVCKEEIYYALKNNKRIIPVFIDDLEKKVVEEFIPGLSKINGIIFQRGHFFQIKKQAEIISGDSEKNQTALPKLPQFEEAVRKLNEAILSDWEWVKFHTRLQMDALRWENSGYEPGYLMRGEDLEEAEREILRAAGKAPQCTDLQTAYITASRREEACEWNEKERVRKRSGQRLWWIIVAFAVGLIPSVFLGVNWFNQSVLAQNETNRRTTSEANTVHYENLAATAQSEAETQRNEVQTQQNLAMAYQLAAQGQALISRDTDLSLLLSMEALVIEENLAEARTSLMAALKAHPRLSATLFDQANPVLTLAFSPDGRILAMGRYDGTIRLWDMSDPQAPAEVEEPLKGNTGGVLSLAFSPDGNILASSGYDGKIQFWDVSDLRHLKALGEPLISNRGYITSITFSPDGLTLAAGGSDAAVWLWDVADRQYPAVLGEPLETYAATVESLAFSPDGQTLAAGIYDYDEGSIWLWDMSDRQHPSILGEPLRDLESGVMGVTFSPDGQILAAAVFAYGKIVKGGEIEGRNNSIWLWDMSNRQNPVLLSEPLQGHSDNIESMAFTLDGKILISASRDKTIRFWNLLDPAQPIALGEHLQGHTEMITSIVISPDGKTLVSGCWDRKIRIWDISNLWINAALDEPLKGHTNYILNVTFSPDGKSMASVDDDGKILLWDVSDIKFPEILGEFQIDQPFVSKNMVYSQDSKTLAFKINNGEIWFLDVSDPRHPVLLDERLEREAYFVDRFAYSADGQILASGCDDGTIKLWDVSDREHPIALGELLSGNTSTVVFVVFSSGNRLLASLSNDGTILLWNISDPRHPEKLEQMIDEEAKTLAFSADGSLLAAGGHEKIQLWDVSDPEHSFTLREPLSGYSMSFISVFFSPDGRTLVSGGSEGSIRLWDISDLGHPIMFGEPLYEGDFHFTTFAISPDGQTLASGLFGSHLVHLWDLDLESWKTNACRIAGRNLTYAEWQQYLPDLPYHLTCTNLPFSDYSISELTDLARDALIAGDQQAAELAYEEALKQLDENENIKLSIQVCRYGSIDGFTGLVLPVCERAVSLAVERGDQQLALALDSRGLARALSGNTAGAIEDFQAYVDFTNQYDFDDETYGPERKKWITKLKAGQNPFNAETLLQLRSEE